VIRMRSDVFEAFRLIDIPEDKDLKADMLLVRWMLGFVLALQIAFAFKVFLDIN